MSVVKRLVDYSNESPRILVTSMQAVLTPLADPRQIEESTRQLTLGAKVNPQELAEWLSSKDCEVVKENDSLITIKYNNNKKTCLLYNRETKISKSKGYDIVISLEKSEKIIKDAKASFIIDEKLFIKKNKFKGKIGTFEIKQNKISHILNFYKVEDEKFKKIF